MDAPALTFLAPPPTEVGPDEVLHDVTADLPGPRRGGSGPSAGGRDSCDGDGGVRMTRGAREAAAGMGISDADVRRCLDEPADVVPDRDHDGRTRFSRGDLTVTAAADGTVLRVTRHAR
jgi:hypothetical protein